MMDKIIRQEDKYYQVSDCSQRFPLLRYTVDIICSDRVVNGESCKDCKAYGSKLCGSTRYWVHYEQKKSLIESDIIKYFGEDVYKDAKKCAEEIYGEEINRIRCANKNARAVSGKTCNSEPDEKSFSNMIKDYTDNGLPVDDIAKKYNISTNNAYKILKGYTRENYYRSRNAKIKDMYENGISASKIGVEFGISDNTVRKILKNIGVVLKGNDILSPKNMCIYTDYVNGMCEREIAKKYGIAVRAVTRILSKVSGAIANGKQ